MKKALICIMICLLIASFAVALVACNDAPAAPENVATNDPSSPDQDPAVETSMTKDAFFTELEKREAAAFADNDLRYASVDCKYKCMEAGEEPLDITDTSAILYSTNWAYASTKIGEAFYRQNGVLGLSSNLKSIVEEHLPADLLPEVKYSASGDNLIFSIDTVYQDVKMVYKKIFNKEGYVLYATEVEGENIMEFTATKYNKTREIDGENLLDRLANYEMRCLHDQSLQYATADIEITKQGSADTDGTYRGTYPILYDDPSVENAKARALVYDDETPIEIVTVLGVRERIFDLLEDEAFTSAQYLVSGSYYDVTITLNNGLTAHYIFDENAYLIYSHEKESDTVQTEIKVTGYNAAQA